MHELLSTHPNGLQATLIALLVTTIIALVVGEILVLVAKRIGRKVDAIADIIRRGRLPLQATLVLLATRVTLGVATGPGQWRDPLLKAHTIALIVAVTWLAGVLLLTVEDVALKRYRIDVADNRRARRARTQVMLIRRLTIAVLVLVAGACVLLQFDAAKAAGTSILASAGIAGVVAGLAAQTSLANIFAGLQLAFTDAIRLDDVVVVEGYWCYVDEITLCYISLRTWDQKNLVVPSTYFTTKPFENWTRKEAAVLGDVTFDLDWRVPVKEMRAKLGEILASTDLWDERVGVLQVTDTQDSFVQIRVLVSAKDGPTLFDLRCEVRERLVEWLRDEHAEALPQLRHSEAVEAPRKSRLDKRQDTTPPGDDARVFSGSPEAEARAQQFTGTIPVIRLDSDGKPAVP